MFHLAATFVASADNLPAISPFIVTFRPTCAVQVSRPLALINFYQKFLLKYACYQQLVT